MLSDEGRKTAAIPHEALNARLGTGGSGPRKLHFNAFSNVLHKHHCAILSEFLDWYWEHTSAAAVNNRVDIRTIVTDQQLERMLTRVDSSSTTTQTIQNLKKLHEKGRAPDLLHRGTLFVFRMTRGPSNSCIDFHFDGDYATQTVQITLFDGQIINGNAVGGCEGGKVLFFVNGKLAEIPCVVGSTVIHSRNVLHGVTSVTSGTRKSLFVLDATNPGGHGVMKVTDDEVKRFLQARKKNQRNAAAHCQDDGDNDGDSDGKSDSDSSGEEDDCKHTANKKPRAA